MPCPLAASTPAAPAFQKFQPNAICASAFQVRRPEKIAALFPAQKFDWGREVAAGKPGRAKFARSVAACNSDQSARAPVQSAFRTQPPKDTPSRTPDSPGNDPCALQTAGREVISAYLPTSSGVSAHAASPPPVPTVGKLGNDPNTARSERTASNPYIPASPYR